MEAEPVGTGVGLNCGDPRYAVILAPQPPEAASLRLGVLGGFLPQPQVSSLSCFLACALPRRPSCTIEPLGSDGPARQLDSFSGFIVPKTWLDDPQRLDETVTARLGDRRDWITLIVPLSITPRGEAAVIHRPFGEIHYKISSSGAVSQQLLPRYPALPRANSAAAVWPPAGEAPDAFRREALGADLGALGTGSGLIVSRADGLPNGFIPPPGTIVLVPGTTTWTKLARRGVMVHGSFDGLGEEEFGGLRSAFPHVTRWLKVSHAAAPAETDLPLVATYRLVPTHQPDDLSRWSHFFWRSGSQFEFYLAANPHLRTATHGAGPGHTVTTIRRHLVAPGQAQIFLSYDDFFSAVVKSDNHHVR